MAFRSVKDVTHLNGDDREVIDKRINRRHTVNTYSIIAFPFRIMSSTFPLDLKLRHGPSLSAPTPGTPPSGAGVLPPSVEAALWRGDQLGGAATPVVSTGRVSDGVAERGCNGAGPSEALGQELAGQT